MADKIIFPKWRDCRLHEMTAFAWEWCMNHGRCEWDEERQCLVVDEETLKQMSDGYSTADCLFNGTERKQRLEKERFIRIVCQ